VSAVVRSAVAALLGADILTALAGIGGNPIDAEVITGLPAAHTDRATFRVVLEDGRVVKARRLRRAGKAERFTRIVCALAHESLPAPLRVDGRITIEAWVEGAIMSTLSLDHDRLRRAADVLASIRIPAGPHPGRRQLRRRGTRRRLRIQRGASRDGSARRSTSVQRLAPDGGIGITHNDFCAESGREAPQAAVVIDNEGFRHGYLD
jgi:hypothetical protein